MQLYRGLMPLVLLPLLLLSNPAESRKNLVLMISDGFGMTSSTLARTYMQQFADSNWTSVLDSMLKGTVRTHSSSSLVTDSAAGATAFACGKKTYNGGIGVDAGGRPCGTILEAAKQKGYRTGLVTTARITHATPAAFAAHVADRDMEDLIALQLIGRNSSQDAPIVDLMLGGGLCHFLAQESEGSCRGDSADVRGYARSSGFTVVDSPEGFAALERPTLPLMGLFAPSHMAFSLDRNTQEQPSLTDMTKQALALLDTAPSDQGFFLMVEGARIDMAAHDNDPATHVHEIIEYWRAVNVVREYVREHPDTLLVSTSDHETGGLALGIDPDYIWHPSVLRSVHRSADRLCAELRQVDDVEDYISTTVMPLLGIHNATNAEITRIADAVDSGAKPCKRAVGGVVSNRAHIGWSTGGHSGADVGLFAYGNSADLLQPSMDNTQLGHLLAKYLEVDTEDVTKVLGGQSTRQFAFTQRYNHHHDHD
ncbi:vacuolar alkaline phosphatase [Coemansia sp. RSA 552]|nr:vacuolar alkaline phosphatase [Coemansia sp. RSA 552]KAJ2159758.1 vacuolar alkaline phosphatase [Coemansia sp. RSA 552]